MNNRKITIAVAVAGVLAVSAQGKIDIPGQQLLKEIAGSARPMSVDSPATSVGVAVVVADGVSVDDASAAIESLGGTVSVVAGRVIVVDIAADRLVEMSELDEVKYVELGTEKELMMDFARRSGGVDAVHGGSVSVDGAPRRFTGKGVLVGLVDQGIDPNHLAFKGRVKAVIDYTDGEKRYETPGEIAGFTTDENFATHGTHVAGILAGGYNGSGKVALCDSPSAQTCTVTEGDVPYYGVATGSDIMFCGGSLTSANVIKGVNAIIEKAGSEGVPAVINLSLGVNNGPHDGSDALSSALSELGKKAVICISAGNEGDIPLCVSKSFTATDREVKTFVTNSTGKNIDIWGNDRTALTVKVAAYNPADGSLRQLCEVNKAGQSKAPAAIFSSYFYGGFSLVSELNPLNNRFHVTVSGTFSPKSGDRYLAVIVEGRAGQEVAIYGNSETTFTDNGVAGWTPGSTDGTLNGVACGANLLSVGAYTTRTSWGFLDGKTDFLGEGFKLGEICDFSSYGMTFAGEQLPHVCAPGANIISAYNSYTFLVPSIDLSDKDMAAMVDNNGITNYWGAMYGTSMSSPFVAGVVALWMEADPTLTFDKVLEIINATSSLPAGIDAEAALRWGAGAIDAEAGLREVLKSYNGVGSVAADDDSRLVITREGDRQFGVFVAGESDLRVALYSVSGALMLTAEGTDGSATVDCGTIAQGVYILVAEGSSSRLTRRVVVK